jgi:glucosamine--fructose-6-phosphate aminotransferase (isomerizing)
MESLLRSEIFEQPAVLRRFLKEEAANIAAISRGLSGREIRYVLIAARGTSDNAARYGQYVFGAFNRLTVALAAPSLFSIYQSAPELRGALVIGISQSGQSPDIVSVVDEARRQMVPAIAITNDPTSPLAAAAEFTIDLRAGTEGSIAATKTYTAELAAMALLSQGLSRRAAAANPLDEVAGWMERALESEPAARAAAEGLADINRCVLLGRGFNLSTTFEIALKTKELAYVAAEPYSSADFQHGPLAIVEDGFPVFLVAAGEKMRRELNALRTDLKERKARVISLDDDGTAGGPTPNWRIPIPAGIPEWLSPLVAIIPGQLWAYYLAKARGIDPDNPRTIRKVTLTR